MSWQNRLCIEGYDSFLCPHAPFEIARREPESDKIVIAHHADGGAKMVMVAPDEKATGADDIGPTRVALSPGTGAIEDVLALVEPAPFRKGWLLVSAHFTTEWPLGVVLCSTPIEAAWPFEMTMPGLLPDEVVYAQGPFQGTGPDPDSLVPEGASKSDEGVLAVELGDARFVEITYVHDDLRWRQRRYWRVLPEATYLVTAQSTSPNAERIFAAGDLVTTGLRYRKPG